MIPWRHFTCQHCERWTTQRHFSTCPYWTHCTQFSSPDLTKIWAISHSVDSRERSPILTHGNNRSKSLNHKRAVMTDDHIAVNAAFNLKRKLVICSTLLWQCVTRFRFRICDWCAAVQQYRTTITIWFRAELRWAKNGSKEGNPKLLFTRDTACS